MVTKDYVSLHPEYGGPARGFRCEHCPKVTRTEAGMKMHLLRKHGIRLQGELFNDGNRNDSTGEVSQAASELSSEVHEGLESQSAQIKQETGHDLRGAL